MDPSTKQSPEPEATFTPQADPIPPDLPVIITEGPYQARLHENLKVLWEGMTKHLSSLQHHVKEIVLSKDSSGVKKFEREWNRDEFAHHHHKLYMHLSGHDCIFYGRLLYRCYEHHLDLYMEKLEPLVRAHKDEEMLLFIIRLWRRYKELYVRYLLKLVSYLDRYYVKNESVSTLKYIAYSKFRKVIYEGDVGARLNSMLIGKIMADRKERAISERNVVRDGVLMLLDMDEGTTYERVFVQALVDKSEGYYRACAAEWLDSGGVVEYFRRASAKVEWEESLLQSVFHMHKQTHTRVMEVCLHELLMQHIGTLLGDEFCRLVGLKREAYPDLSIVFRLMSRLGNSKGTERLSQKFGAFCDEQGMLLHRKYAENAMVADTVAAASEELVDNYVDELLQFRRDFEEVVNEPFDNCAACSKVLFQAIKRFSNKSFVVNKANGTQLHPPQLFAAYCDKIIHKGPDDLDQKLEDAIDFVQYFEEKDMFIREYSRHLATRLLSNQSQDEEEKVFVGKIKLRYGQSTDAYKLEKMLSDKAASASLGEQFREYCVTESVATPFEIEVKVLTRSMWPRSIGQISAMSVERSIEEAQTIFVSFYKRKHESRNLNWAYLNSKCQMICRYERVECLVTMTTIQGVICMLYNEKAVMTLDEIRTSTELKANFVLRSVIPILQKKMLVRGKGSGKKMMRTTKIVLNKRFHSRLTKFELPRHRITREGSAQLREQMENERKWVLDAAIVRIMKTRKKLGLQVLTNEVVTQVTTFNPQPIMIKRRIEHLIEQQYLKRSEDDLKVLEYVA